MATDNFFNKLLRVEIEKIDPGAPPGTWRPKLIWKNVWGNQSEIYDVDTIGILFKYGKKNTGCNMVSIERIPIGAYIKFAGLKMIQVPIGSG